jgi:hypothetical protein
VTVAPVRAQQHVQRVKRQVPPRVLHHLEQTRTCVLYRNPINLAHLVGGDGRHFSSRSRAVSNGFRLHDATRWAAPTADRQLLRRQWALIVEDIGALSPAFETEIHIDMVLLPARSLHGLVNQSVHRWPA